jgi:hypothetical protein
MVNIIRAKTKLAFLKSFVNFMVEFLLNFIGVFFVIFHLNPTKKDTFFNSLVSYLKKIMADWVLRRKSSFLTNYTYTVLNCKIFESSMVEI